MRSIRIGWQPDGRGSLPSLVGVKIIRQFLEKVRKAEKNYSIKRRIVAALGITLLGFALGVLQKWLDSTPANVLPMIIQQLDVGNYFGRLAIWILLAAVISVYAESPLRAAINTFCFFIGMLTGYYLYCHFVLGFLPITYMMIWVGISCASFFLAYICWYAKGEGIAAIIISSLILGVLLAQAVSFTQGFYVYHPLEALTWIVGVIILRRKPKELAAELGLSVVIAFAYQLVIPHWG